MASSPLRAIKYNVWHLAAAADRANGGEVF